MIFYAMTPTEDGDTRTLAKVDWPVLPRAGEIIILAGLVAVEHQDKPYEEQPQEEIVFEVYDVCYRFDTDTKTMGPNATPLDGVPVIEVFVRPAFDGSVWAGA